MEGASLNNPSEVNNNENVIAQEINSMTEEELLELRKALFLERVGLENEKKAQQDFFNKIQDERNSFREEMKILNSKVLAERKALKDEQSFFDKKMMILQSGFARLEMDRKEFEREKKKFSSMKFSTGDSISVESLFAGINTPLGLKKRYKDLIKIFHPDNLDGDNDMVIAIKEEYERLLEKM